MKQLGRNVQKTPRNPPVSHTIPQNTHTASYPLPITAASICVAADFHSSFPSTSGGSTLIPSCLVGTSSPLGTTERSVRMCTTLKRPRVLASPNRATASLPATAAMIASIVWCCRSVRLAIGVKIRGYRGTSGPQA